MMYNEFLKISGQDITYQQYTEVIEPMYNAVESMTKFEFIDFMMPSIRAMAKKNLKAKKVEELANQETVFVSDGAKTPNGCYYMGAYKKLVSTDAEIKSGKLIVTLRDLTEDEEKELNKTWDSYLSYHIDYLVDEECGISIDSKGRDVVVKNI